MKILYIEDDYLFAMTLKLLSKDLGYDCVIAKNYDEGLAMFEEVKPDLLIVDVNLKDGKRDGITLAETIREKLDVPLIFLTSEISDEVFNRALKTNPFTFLNKPISEINLKRVIELALSSTGKSEENKTDQDIFFVREGQKFIKLQVSQTKYVEVQDKYCTIHTTSRPFILRMGLKDLIETLPESFVQIHRSFVINIDWMESLNQTKREVHIGGEILPIGRSFYDQLKSNIRYLEKFSD